MTTGPLAGVTVLDISQAAVGPWAGMLLGQLGADVIKLEPPAGDLIHYVKPTQNGLGTTYATMNLNKRGVILDLKDPQDRAAALALAKKADVVIENFRPGVVERLGIDYAAVRALNPRVVYCSVTGFGRTGPMKDMGCTDQHAQAFCGYGALNGEPEGTGELMRYYAHHDLTTAMIVTQAVLSGLWARERTGEGQQVETSMLQAGLALQRVRLMEYFTTGIAPTPQGSAISYCAPDQAFLCGDARHVAVSVTSEPEWRAFCAAAGLPELEADPRFARNADRVRHRGALVAILAERFAAAPAPWWVKKLNAAGVPASLYFDYEQQRHHAHFHEGGMIVEVEKEPWGTLAVGGLPWRFDGTPCAVEPPPFPGEHTQQVAAEYGVSAKHQPGSWRLPPRDPEPAAAGKEKKA
ncbi:MAG: CoA transferase [Salinarimonadaceae bacterium]|nr:MAG: CoA transferase [Salinarimonadaceae bacterium]